jgi:hypothetical protein
MDTQTIKAALTKFTAAINENQSAVRIGRGPARVLHQAITDYLSISPLLNELNESINYRGKSINEIIGSMKKLMPENSPMADLTQPPEYPPPTSFDELTTIYKLIFNDLANSLSPENLAGDGEYTRAQIKSRRKIFKSQWRKLEKEVGFKVSVIEVENWYILSQNPGKE